MSPNLRAARQFAGGGGGSGTSVVKVKEVVLNYNAALSYQPLPLAAGDLVVSIDAEVVTTFNAAGESVAVGVVGDPNRYFAPGAINLNAAGITSKTVLDQITLASQVLVSFVRGVGGTQGQVRLVIRYVPQASSITIPFLVSIAVTPAAATINGGGVTQQFTATGTYSDLSTQDITAQCVWASTNPGAATINPATGLATSTGGGSTTISATQGAVSGSTSLGVTAVIVSIAVTPVTPLLPNIIVPGSSQQYKAVATYSDASTLDVSATAVWATTTPGIVSVGVAGLVTGIANGLGDVRATKDAITGITSQDVRTVASVAWVRPGGAITAALTAPDTLAGYDLTFRVTYTDASTADVDAWVTFGSDNPAVLTMAAGGLLTAVAPGAANAQGTYFGVTYNLPVTVKTLASLALSYPFAQMPQMQFMAATLTGTFTDLSTADVRDMATYTSDDPIIAITNTPVNYGGINSGVLAGMSPAAPEDANLQANIGAVFSPLVLIQVGEVFGGLMVTVDTNPVSVGNSGLASSSGSYFGIVGAFDLTSFTTFSTIGVNLFVTPPRTYTGLVAGVQNVTGTINNPNFGGTPQSGFVPVTVVP